MAKEQKDQNAYKQGTYLPPTQENISPPPRPAKKPKAGDSGMDQLMKSFSDVSRTLRMLEERYINLRRKSQVTEQNMININKNLNREIKTINSEIDEVRRNLEDLKKNIKLVQKDLESCAAVSELNTLKKYVGFWEPLNYVTENEVKRMIQEVKTGKRKI